MGGSDSHVAKFSRGSRRQSVRRSHPAAAPLYLAASQRRNLATPEELFSKSCMQYGYVDTRQLGKLQSNLRLGWRYPKKLKAYKCAIREVLAVRRFIWGSITAGDRTARPLSPLFAEVPRTALAVRRAPNDKAGRRQPLW